MPARANIEHRIWEQLADETPAQYRAFQCYMQERSISAAYRLYAATKKRRKAQKSVGNSEKSAGNAPKSVGNASKSVAKAQVRVPQSFRVWSRAFRWQERVAAYDAHVHRSVEEMRIAAQADFYRGRFESYRNTATAAIERIQSMINETTRVLDLLELVKHFDQEAVAALERKQLAELQKLQSTGLEEENNE